MIRNIEDHKMNFITQPDYVKQVTAMRLNPNKKFLLVCEQHVKDPSCFLSVYDLKSIETPRMKTPHINVTEMSRDMGVATQAQKPDATSLFGTTGQGRETNANQPFPSAAATVRSG